MEFLLGLLTFILKGAPMGIIYYAGCWIVRDYTLRKIKLWSIISAASVAASLFWLCIDEHSIQIVVNIVLLGGVVFALNFLRLTIKYRKENISFFDINNFAMGFRDPDARSLILYALAFGAACGVIGLFSMLLSVGLITILFAINLSWTLLQVSRTKNDPHTPEKLLQAIGPTITVQTPEPIPVLSMTLEEKTQYFRDNEKQLNDYLSTLNAVGRYRANFYNVWHTASYFNMCMQLCGPGLTTWQMQNTLCQKSEHSAELFYQNMVAFCERVESDRSATLAGVQGEARTMKILSALETPSFRCLFNLRFMDGNTSSECDAVIVCSQGIFCIEIKSYGNEKDWSLLVTSDGQWRKVYADSTVPLDQNPVEQNMRHVATLNRRFSQLWNGNDSLVKPIICISSDVQLQNDSPFLILRDSSLHSYIVTQLPNRPEMTPECIASICSALQAAAVPAARFPCPNYIAEAEAWVKIRRSLETAYDLSEANSKPL